MSKANNSKDDDKEFSQYLTPKGSVFGYLYKVGEIPNCNPPLYGVTISIPTGKADKVRHGTLDLIVTDARVYRYY